MDVSLLNRHSDTTVPKCQKHRTETNSKAHYVKWTVFTSSYHYIFLR